MKGKIVIIGMISISLVFAIACGSFWLGTKQRSAVLTQSDVPALGIAPASTEQTEENSVVNVNTATVEELMMLPGIGELLANAIVEYRDTYGAFHSIWELTAIEGIGEGKLEAITPYVITE